MVLIPVFPWLGYLQLASEGTQRRTFALCLVGDDARFTYCCGTVTSPPFDNLTSTMAPLWTARNSLAAIDCTALKTRNHGPTAGKPHAPARWRSLCPAGILEQADDRIVIVHSVIAELRETLR